MTAQHPHPADARVADILFVAEQTTARHRGNDVADDLTASDKAREAMFILLTRLSRAGDHQHHHERAELLASVRRS